MGINSNKENNKKRDLRFFSEVHLFGEKLTIIRIFSLHFEISTREIKIKIKKQISNIHPYLYITTSKLIHSDGYKLMLYFNI